MCIDKREPLHVASVAKQKCLELWPETVYTSTPMFDRLFSWMDIGWEEAVEMEKPTNEMVKEESGVGDEELMYPNQSSVPTDDPGIRESFVNNDQNGLVSSSSSPVPEA
jgi:hypothetical protein